MRSRGKVSASGMRIDSGDGEMYAETIKTVVIGIMAVVSVIVVMLPQYGKEGATVSSHSGGSCFRIPPMYITGKRGLVIVDAAFQSDAKPEAFPVEVRIANVFKGKFMGRPRKGKFMRVASSRHIVSGALPGGICAPTIGAATASIYVTVGSKAMMNFWLACKVCLALLAVSGLAACFWFGRNHRFESTTRLSMECVVMLFLALRGWGTANPRLIVALFDCVCIVAFCVRVRVAAAQFMASPSGNTPHMDVIFRRIVIGAEVVFGVTELIADNMRDSLHVRAYIACGRFIADIVFLVFIERCSNRKCVHADPQTRIRISIYGPPTRALAVVMAGCRFLYMVSSEQLSMIPELLFMVAISLYALSSLLWHLPCSGTVVYENINTGELDAMEMSLMDDG